MTIYNYRNDIIETLLETKKTIRGCLFDIKEENQNGKQFDYVNSPRLPDVVDGLKKIVDELNDIVYQK